jgi:hypothetical protein
MLSLIFGSQKKSEGDIIKDALGGYKYMYFSFVEKFRREPKDIDDFIDGIIYIELNGYFEREQMRKE